MEKNSQPSKQTPAQKNNGDQRMYPELNFSNNTHPVELYALPVIGLFFKLIMIIPVAIVYFLLSLVFDILLLITPFVILFTGKYWNTAYTFNLGFFTYGIKIQLFLAGITDKYPGFSLKPDGIFELHLAKPESPSRLLAFPAVGFVIRLLLLIPYILFQTILQYGMYGAIVASWFCVLIRGKYPESLYEFIKDELRISIASGAYLSYLSDTYPSFKISMNHKKVKIILLILGIVITLLDVGSQINDAMHPPQPSSYNTSIQNSSGY